MILITNKYQVYHKAIPLGIMKCNNLYLYLNKNISMLKIFLSRKPGITDFIKT